MHNHHPCTCAFCTEKDITNFCSNRGCDLVLTDGEWSKPMAKVKIDITVKSKGGNSVMTFDNTRQLLNFLARTGGKVLKDSSIRI